MTASASGVETRSSETIGTAPTGRSATPRDAALWAILGANLLTLATALWQRWGLLELLWPYWMQSLIIGYFARRRILALMRLSTTGLVVNDRVVPPTDTTRVSIAHVFTLLYGLFHLVYLMFLLIFTAFAADTGNVKPTFSASGNASPIYLGQVQGGDWLFFLALGVGFWLAHRASYGEHIAADLAGRPHIGTLMFLPFARVVPMHLTLFFALLLGGTPAILLFAVLKTGADLTLHRAEHRRLQATRG